MWFSYLFKPSFTPGPVPVPVPAPPLYQSIHPIRMEDFELITYPEIKRQIYNPPFDYPEYILEKGLGWLISKEILREIIRSHYKV